MATVSIIMGIYNCEDYLRESIESIFNQTYTDWELILCDDGSSDHTYKIAEEYKNKFPQKIILLKNNTNRGLNYTLNKCLHVATGKYIARQDGDDRSLPSRLSKEVEFLDQHPEYVIVGTNMNFFDQNGIWGCSTLDGEVKKEDFTLGSPFMHPTVLMNKAALISVHGYSEGKKLNRVEDYHLWFKFYINGFKGFNIRDKLYDYRDDRVAFSKRTKENRINLFHLQKWGFKKLNLNKKYWWIPYKQLVLILLPNWIYERLHKYKWKV